MGALLEFSVWLSGRLSFKLKYLLVGIVTLCAMAALSLPLWRTISEDRGVAELERVGLAAVRAQSELLAELVALRDRAIASPQLPDLAPLDAPLQALFAQLDTLAQPPRSGNGAAMAAQLAERWRQVRSLPAQASAPQRFAALNGVINAVLALIEWSAQQHRLNVDPQLDVALGALTLRLPQVLDTLGKQSGALTLQAPEFAPFALSAQVLLTESVPSLRAAKAQLESLAPGGGLLGTRLEDLLAGIAAQQDLADKAEDGPQVAQGIAVLAAKNQVMARRFIGEMNRAIDQQLQARIDSLKRSQWVLGTVLVGALAAIAYLFAGIYISTVRTLNNLARGTAKFCAGSLDTRIRIDTKDELVVVADNFNTMAVEFSRLLGVIREQNESRERELETQVQARTAELAEKNQQLSDAAQRVQEELALARDMQRALLPQQFPPSQRWSVHAYMEPARELGGDFYDVIPLPGERLGLLVADVSGKGVGAAFFMAVSRTVLLDVAAQGAAPAQVLGRANDLLCARNPMGLFITVCYAVFDTTSGALEYASGGHPSPLRRHADGRVEALPVPCDLALAVMPDVRYETMRTTLAPLDTLLLYTDGVTEAFSPLQEAYGEQRLRAWLGRMRPGPQAQALVQALVSDVHHFVAGAEPSDDLTCLILSPQRGDSSMPTMPPPVQMTNKVLLLEYSLPSQLPEIGRLAERVDEVLPDRPDLAFSANLCLEELITNIITHGLQGRGGHEIRVRISLSVEWLEIILKDDAPPFDPFSEVPAPDLDAELDQRPIGGLGVHLVKSLMDDARAYYDGSGNLIVLLKTTQRAGKSAPAAG